MLRKIEKTEEIGQLTRQRDFLYSTIQVFVSDVICTGHSHGWEPKCNWKENSYPPSQVQKVHLIYLLVGGKVVDLSVWIHLLLRNNKELKWF